MPRKTVLEVQRLLEDSDEPVALDVAPGQIVSVSATSSWCPAGRRQVSGFPRA